MSSFTFTAPVVTEQQEKEEREALSDEERKKLHEDVYGGEQLVTETEEMLRNGAWMLDEAVLAIPDEEKAAYLEALESAPELVEQESDPVPFLRCEKYDAWAAAQHLVAYWDVRKKIFGAERAFLPMTQSGAMAEDREYLEKALAMILPDDDCDRSVIYVDRIRTIRAIAPRDSVLRCLFYMLHVLCQRENTQRRGFVMVANLRVSAQSSILCFGTMSMSMRLAEPATIRLACSSLVLFCFVLQGYDLYQHFDRIMTKKMGQIVNCVPAKLKGMHGCTGSGKSVLGLVLPVMKQVAGKEIRLRFHLHVSNEIWILIG
jgi:hypothetical protein